MKNKISDVEHVNKLIKYIKDNEIKNIFLDMDGTICEFSFDDKLLIDNWMQEGMFINRRPMAKVIEIIEYIKKECGCRIYILSMSPNSVIGKEKYKWIENNIKELVCFDDIYLTSDSKYKVKDMENILWKDDNNYISVTGIHPMYLTNLKSKTDEERLVELKEQTLIVEDTHSILFEAEKQGYHAWHVSKLVN